MKRNIMRAFKLNELSAVDFPAQQPALARILKRRDSDPANPGGDSNGTGGNNMPADVQKQLDDMTKKVAEMQTALDTVTKAADEAKAKITVVEKERDDAKAEAETLKAKADMCDDDKSYFDEEKDDAKKAAFLAMDKAGRADFIAKRKSGDESVTIEGRTIFKSKVGDDMFVILKAQAEKIAKQADDVQKAKDEAEMAKFAKQADDTYGHLPGTGVEKGAVLKAIAGMPEAIRKTFDAMMLAGQTAIEKSGAFTTLGVRAAKKGDASPADFDKKVAEIRAREPSLSRTQAMDKARVEFPDLFKSAFPESTQDHTTH